MTDVTAKQKIMELRERLDRIGERFDQTGTFSVDDLLEIGKVGADLHDLMGSDHIVRSFTCEACGAVGLAVTTEVEVAAEFKEMFGRDPDPEGKGDARVCDDCFRELLANQGRGSIH